MWPLALFALALMLAVLGVSLSSPSTGAGLGLDPVASALMACVAPGSMALGLPGPRLNGEGP